MLDPQQREKLENAVRPILCRRMERGERLSASREKSLLPEILRRLREMTEPPPLDPFRFTVPNDLQSWVLDVDLALHYIGFAPAYIVMARLTRRSKSSERSWETIVAELEDLDRDMSISDAKHIYENALPALATIFDVRGITTSYREDVAA